MDRSTRLPLRATHMPGAHARNPLRPNALARRRRAGMFMAGKAPSQYRTPRIARRWGRGFHASPNQRDAAGMNHGGAQQGCTAGMRAGMRAEMRDGDARRRCAPGICGEYAHLRCTAWMRASDVQRGCPAGMPNGIARRRCPAGMPSADAQRRCAAAMPNGDARRTPNHRGMNPPAGTTGSPMNWARAGRLLPPLAITEGSALSCYRERGQRV